MAHPLFLHDFPTNTTRFPAWESIPLNTEPDSSCSSSSDQDEEREEPEHFLVAQISENMTITKPTLILVDRDTRSFALTFDDESFDLKGWRKGHTVVVPGATRTPPREEGKKGFVRVPRERCREARMVPGGMEKVVGMAVAGVVAADGKSGSAECGFCGGGGERRCTGCGWVRYCSKECQVKAWNGDHKGDCKVYRVLRELGQKYPS